MALLFHILTAAGLAVARYTTSDPFHIAVVGFENFVTFITFLFTR